MNTPSTLMPPTAPPDDEIDLRQLAAALQRHWRLIAKVAGGALLLSGINAFTQPRVWEGQFQIVLASSDSGGGRFAQLAAANPMLAGLAWLSGGGGLQRGNCSGGHVTSMDLSDPHAQNHASLVTLHKSHVTRHTSRCL